MASNYPGFHKSEAKTDPRERDWAAQEKAFFGLNPSAPPFDSSSAARSGGGGASRGSVVPKETDEQMAKRLEQQWRLDELTAQQEKEDEELAAALAQMGEDVAPTNFAAQPKKKSEEDDMNLALRLQKEEDKNAKRRPTISPPTPAATAGAKATSSSRPTTAVSFTPPSPNHCYGCNGSFTSGFSGTILTVKADQRYHPQCFTCAGCSSPITELSFNLAKDLPDAHGRPLPVHSSCYAELFAPKCSVCRSIVPKAGRGAGDKYVYCHHPFFSQWRYCEKHEREGGKCQGCGRIEPLHAPFNDLCDEGRRLCNSCCRTVILDSNDLKPIWISVLAFLSSLGLPIWPDMKNIPVLSVNHGTLNAKSISSNHVSSRAPTTRGLCLSETQLQTFRSPVLSFAGSSSRGPNYSSVVVGGNASTSVTAVLCLSGLPSDLSASIVAHEAVHAWFKLHPSYARRVASTRGGQGHIDAQVEEGCCQLVAYLYLESIARAASSKGSAKSDVDADGPSDEDLRKYFSYSIETDPSPVYGEGYRIAANIFASIGIEALLEHVVETGSWPQA